MISWSVWPFNFPRNCPIWPLVGIYPYHRDKWSLVGIKKIPTDFLLKLVFFVGIFMQDPPTFTKVFHISGMIFIGKMHYPPSLI